MCLAVTCLLHFWQNDRDLLRATAYHVGGTDAGEKNVSTESRLWRRKFSRRSCRDWNPKPFNHESSTLTTELSPFPTCCMESSSIQISCAWTSPKSRSVVRGEILNPDQLCVEKSSIQISCAWRNPQSRSVVRGEVLNPNQLCVEYSSAQITCAWTSPD